MYLTYLPHEVIADLRLKFDADQNAVAFYNKLRSKEKIVLFSIDPVDESIIYEAMVDDKTVAGFKIHSDKKLSSCRGFYSFDPTSEELALVIYTYEVETSSTEEELRKRYGVNYSALSSIAPLSGDELEALMESRGDFRDLIEDLRYLQDDPASSGPTITPKLTFRLSNVSRSFCDLLPVVIGNNIHNIRSYTTFFRDIRNESMLADGRGNYLSLAISSFSQEDQRILFTLMGYSSDSPELGYGSGKAINPSVAADILSSCLGKSIYINGQIATIDGEIHSVSVSLDENGKLQADAMPRGDIVIYGKSCLLAYVEKEGKVHVYNFPNEKAKALFRFVQQHPSFPYHALQEEVASSLLPLVSKDIKVADAFKEKALAYRSSIIYKITYEEGEDKPRLIFETTFLNRGTPISKAEYQATPNSNFQGFADALSELDFPENGEFNKDEDIGRALTSDFSILTPLCSLYLSDNIKPTLVKKHPSINFSTSSGMDWFSVEANSDELSAEEINAILKAYKKKKKYVRIGTSYFQLEDKILSSADLIPDGDDVTSEKLPLYQALKLKSEFGDTIEIDEKLQALFARLLDFSNNPVDLDPSIAAILRPYQLEGVKWLKTLADNSLGGILADDMGLGKTLEMIAYLSLTKDEESTLIVAPKSLLYNWKNEFHRFDPNRSVHVIDGSKSIRTAFINKMKAKKREVFIVSYDSLRNDEGLYQDIQLSNLILDEAQYIANAKAQKSKAVKNIASKHRFALTGTPIQNSFLDLWSIMDFLMPKYLEGYNEFRMLYSGFSEEKTAEIRKLEAEIAPFLLRRRKEDVLKDLPPKTEEIMVISMDEKENKLYQAYLENAKMTMHQQRENHRARVAVLAELTRLRQICVDPSVFLESFDKTSSKLEQTLSMIHTVIADGHKVLIFSSFVSILKHLQDLLNKDDISSALIYGDTPAKERLALSDDFNKKEKSRVMLVSLKAGGTGLNLVGADIVIHLDPWWNIAAENQASDRAHRIGQTRPVTVYKLVAKGTIEEKIIQLQELKKGLSDILRDSKEEGSGLTEEDIEFLLS